MFSIILNIYLQVELIFEFCIFTSIIVSAIIGYNQSNQYSDRNKDNNFISLPYTFYLLVIYFDTNRDLALYLFAILSILEFAHLKFFKSRILLTALTTFLFNLNTIDIVRGILSIVWITLKFQHFLGIEAVTWYFAGINLFRGLSGFRTFDLTRRYLNLLASSVITISPFLIILIYIMIFLGGVLYSIANPEGGHSLFHIIWIKSFGFLYNPMSDKSYTILDFRYITYMLISFTITTVMLNLLISVLGEAYDKFKETEEEGDYRQMNKALLEMEETWHPFLTIKGKISQKCAKKTVLKKTVEKKTVEKKAVKKKTVKKKISGEKKCIEKYLAILELSDISESRKDSKYDKNTSIATLLKDHFKSKSEEEMLVRKTQKKKIVKFNSY